jgi:hypothetical protein
MQSLSPCFDFIHALLALNLNLRKRNVRAAASSFLLLDISEYRIRIVVELGGVGIAYATHFIDDGVVHGFTFLSSSGVQMIGAL